MKSLAEADAIGQDGIPGEGPYMTLYLRLEGENIAEASFETYGCPAAIACGSWLTQWITGKTADAASIITADDLMRVVGGLPLGKEHCASLAVNALRSAMRSWQDEM